MVSKAREIFVLATERDATTRRRAAFILFSFLTSAGVRENRCGVFEEIVEKKSRQVRVDRNRPNARDRLDRVGEPVISTAALSFFPFSGQRARVPFFSFSPTARSARNVPSRRFVANVCTIFHERAKV